MHKFFRILAALVSGLLLTSCFNAVSYHQSERLSITVEAKGTDPQQPIQANIGIKNRTVLVAPGRDGTMKFNDILGSPGESSSVVSDFYVNRAEGGLFDFGTTTIRSAFIAGAAAKAAPAQSAVSIAGLDASLNGDLSVMRQQMLEQVLDILGKNASTDSNAKKYLDELNLLAKLLPDSTAFTNLTFFTIVTKLDAAGTRQYAIKEQSHSTPTLDFQGIIDYEKWLQTSLQAIHNFEKNRSYQVSDSANNYTYATSTQEMTIDTEKKKLSEARDTLFNTILNSPIIDAAANYVVSIL